ncbi:MAG: hypothetical protein J6S78_07685 [Lachnospiraceae bacterium]|nr:hypothetical protein [Lachnospiraceae bacterium]
MKTIRNLATRMLRWWCYGELFIDSVKNKLNEDKSREKLDFIFNAKKYIDAAPMGNVIKVTAAMIFCAPIMWFAKIYYLWKYKHQKSEEEA